MATNPLYIPLFNIEEVILDKDTGLPLAAGVVTFYRDSQRQTPKAVYQISGTEPNYTYTDVGNQFTLGLCGTFVDGNGNPFVPYAYPYDADGEVDLYYVTVESSGAVAQFTRQAVPYLPDTTIPPNQRTSTANELSNSQFVEVLFPTSGSVTYSVTGTNTVTKVAPGWDIITTGSGTLTLERLQPTSANIVTNPPYALSITGSAGFGASITLRQRLNNSPSLMRGEYGSGSFVAAVLAGGGSNLSMTYAPSTGSPTTIIPSVGVPTDGAYHIIQNNALIGQQGNSPADTGYVDINIIIPTSRTIAITSIQIVGTAESINIPYDEESADRQRDHLFHYYENAVVVQPKASILAGWNFPMNPWHYPPSGSSALANLANNAYTADQTIIIQQAYVDTATANNVQIGRASYTENQVFQIKAVTANNKVMMLQYIDPATMRPYWGKKLSVMVRASVTLGAGHTTTPRFKLRLMYKAGLPGTISQTVPVSAWSGLDDSIPTVSGDGWTYLNSINDPTYTLTSGMQNFSFHQFQLPASSNSSMTLGVALIMMNNLDQTGAADVINIDSVSLVQNDFAMLAQSETYDEALRKCQFYYEYSWDQESVIGLATQVGSVSAQVASLAGAVANLNRAYKVLKRNNATVTWYSPVTGTANRLYDVDAAADITVNSTSNNASNVTGFPNLAVGLTDGHTVIAHYTADARLGL